jgi:hypothetical protein
VCVCVFIFLTQMQTINTRPSQGGEKKRAARQKKINVLLRMMTVHEYENEVDKKCCDAVNIKRRKQAIMQSS